MTTDRASNPQTAWLRLTVSIPDPVISLGDLRGSSRALTDNCRPEDRAVGRWSRKPVGSPRELLRRVLVLSLLLGVVFLNPRLGAESRHYREAVELYEKQQTLMAMLSAQKAVEEDPENADHLFLYGLILTDLKQFSEAEVQLRKAVSLRPRQCRVPLPPGRPAAAGEDGVEGHAGTGRGGTPAPAWCGGTEQEALDSLEAAVKLDPNHFKARLHLGRNYYEHNQHLKARRQFEAVLERDQAYPWLHYHLSMLHSNRGEVQAAIRELEKELELHPTHAQARLELGEWLVKIGLFERGLSHLSQVKQDEVHPVDLNYAIAKAHRGLGNPEQALDAGPEMPGDGPRVSPTRTICWANSTGKPGNRSWPASPCRPSKESRRAPPAKRFIPLSLLTFGCSLANMDWLSEFNPLNANRAGAS